MTTKQALQFMLKLKSDPNLEQRFRELGDDDAGVRTLAQEAGFDFSPEAWQAALGAVSGELGEAELDRVSAGGEPTAATWSRRWRPEDITVEKIELTVEKVERA